jgi:hypothetical protein
MMSRGPCYTQQRQRCETPIPLGVTVLEGLVGASRKQPDAIGAEGTGENHGLRGYLGACRVYGHVITAQYWPQASEQFAPALT